MGGNTSFCGNVPGDALCNDVVSILGAGGTVLRKQNTEPVGLSRKGTTKVKLPLCLPTAKVTADRREPQEYRSFSPR
jgi:hypothetical protein